MQWFYALFSNTSEILPKEKPHSHPQALLCIPYVDIYTLTLKLNLTKYKECIFMPFKQKRTFYLILPTCSIIFNLEPSCQTFIPLNQQLNLKVALEIVTDLL